MRFAICFCPTQTTGIALHVESATAFGTTELKLFGVVAYEECTVTRVDGARTNVTGADTHLGDFSSGALFSVECILLIWSFFNR